MSPAANIQVCKPRQRQKDRPAIIPCKLLISDIEFLAWVSQAEPGDRLAYHRGFLAVDCDMAVGNLSAEDRKTLGNLAHKASGAFEVGLSISSKNALGSIALPISRLPAPNRNPKPPPPRCQLCC
ncbi:MAG: hypothetical protein ACI8R4_002718 [Paracoccaceae bacterium]|jgi:hypothetical protein